MKDIKQLKETIVPVVAPLNKDLSLDRDAVGRVFSYLYANNAIPFILGTTGESASLSASFKEEYLRTAVDHKLESQKLYVGISSNIVTDSIEFAHLAHNLGIEAVATTLPTYYKLSEAQMEKYFLQLAEEIPTDLIIYNIPATTHMSIPLDLLDRLSYHPKIVAVKDSERSIERLDNALALWRDRPDFKHYMGWAGQSAYALINGSDGIIPSSGNFAPGIYHQMCIAVQEGDFDRAYSLQKQSDNLGELYQANKSLGESLWALKVLMRELSLCDPFMMPPLYELSKGEENKLIGAFQALINQENIKLNITNHA
ncbi:dihydrodipicolinate synthase family protein [Sphingobacterium alkalisoli]|uniref:Dihydrodipicolinate synthase family protein n=1 Tax=Sphingobacterium alkalisoli TaxID=1874115 RepID=A0A4U0HBH3_9SPHI|nr:dihydrodipicolinate synthase family protein [Sphingobacterium alkalisoli]TJY67932.1 dihydrodipicolinate synthase family protein [Sphingobacterium alkalisoli]GGH10294.1 dihydrodipicolinate synthase family protein [Sphingobacterium alkalisoli]